MNRFLPVLYAVLFAAAHTQSPLYYSNQNQYFLKGLAAGTGSPLQADWLTSTFDPVPAFSAFVEYTVRYVGEWPFQAVFFVAIAGYFLAAWRLVHRTPFAPPSPLAGLAFAVGFTAIHSGLLRWGSYQLLGADYLWFFHCGLANQYILGPGLQPSVIGVLLLWAIAEYAGDRPILAAGLAAAATLIHSTYLLPAGMLVAGFLVHLLAHRRWKTAAISAGVAVLLVVPSIWYTLSTFAPENPEQFAEAQRILADVRIPHHTHPARWFDWMGGVQVAWLLLGLLLLRKTRLFVPLAVVYALVAVGTAAVIVTGNPTLSLVFPWRVTAAIIPACTAVTVAAGVTALLKRPATSPSPAFWVTLSLFATFCVGSAATVYALRLGYREPAAEDGVLSYIAATKEADHLYLIPARFPKPSNSRGVYSNTFAPPPDPTKPVFFELARFRLATLARMYVDFKSIPYQGGDVLEWSRRIAQCERWFAQADWDTTGVIDEVIAEGITHVVAPTAKPIRSERLEPVYEDPTYRVYRVR